MEVQPLASYEDALRGRQRWIVWTLGFAVGIVGILWVLSSEERFDDYHFLFFLLSISLILGSPYILFFRGHRRVVLLDDRLLVYRNGLLWKEFPHAQFKHLRSFMLMIFARFNDGTWITLETNQPGGEAIVEYYQNLIEKRERAFVGGEKVASGDMILPLSTLTFPGRCVACDKKSTATYSLEARRGVELIVLRWSTTRLVPVPTCSGCRLKRRVIGSLTFLFWLGIGFALIYRSSVQLPAYMDWPGLPFLLWLATFPFFTNYEDRLIDRFVLGVTAWRLESDLSHARFRFRDRHLAAEVAALTEGRQSSQHLATGQVI